MFIQKPPIREDRWLCLYYHSIYICVGRHHKPMTEYLVLISIARFVDQVKKIAFSLLFLLFMLKKRLFLYFR